MNLSIVVTRHAVRRYLERVMGFDFTFCDKHRLNDHFAVDVACDQLGIDRAAVEAEIALEVAPRMPETVRLRGTRRIVTGVKAKYVVEHGRVVMTVYPSDWKRDEQGLARDRSAAQGR